MQTPQRAADAREDCFDRAKRRNIRIRGLFVTTHRCLGLAIAGFMLLSGISGSIAVFSHEIDAILNPGLFRIEEVGARPLPSGKIADLVETADPKVTVRYLPLPQVADKAVTLFVDERQDPATGSTYDVGYDQVFVNPVTGEIKGVRKWGQCCERKNIVPLIYKFHNRMLLPLHIGRPIWGVIGIAWIVTLIIGAYLTLPRAKPFWKKWKMSWTPGRRVPFPQRDLRLHSASGLWLWIVLLLVAASGVGLALQNQIFRPLVTSVSTVTDTVWDRRSAMQNASQSEDGISFSTALAVATRYAAKWGNHPAPSEVWFSNERKLFRIVFGSRQKGGRGPSNVYIDSRSAEVAGSSLARDGTLGDILENSIQPLHAGRIAGMPGRVLVFLSGLGVATLSVTGVLMWWRRRSRRRPLRRSALRSREPQPQRSP